jgi:hypothetical protein
MPVSVLVAELLRKSGSLGGRSGTGEAETKTKPAVRAKTKASRRAIVVKMLRSGVGKGNGTEPRVDVEMTVRRVEDSWTGARGER